MKLIKILGSALSLMLGGSTLATPEAALKLQSSALAFVDCSSARFTSVQQLPLASSPGMLFSSATMLPKELGMQNESVISQDDLINVTLDTAIPGLLHLHRSLKVILYPYLWYRFGLSTVIEEALTDTVFWAAGSIIEKQSLIDCSQKGKLPVTGNFAATTVAETLVRTYLTKPCAERLFGKPQRNPNTSLSNLLAKLLSNSVKHDTVITIGTV